MTNYMYLVFFFLNIINYHGCHLWIITSLKIKIRFPKLLGNLVKVDCSNKHCLFLQITKKEARKMVLKLFVFKTTLNTEKKYE